VWKAFEEEHGGEAEVAKVQAMMPLVTKKRRPVADSDVLEECEPIPPSPPVACIASSENQCRRTSFRADWDMVFPDDERESNAASFKFLEMAHKWKQTQAAARVSNAPPVPPNKEPTNLNENSKNSVRPEESDEAASSGDEE
jgi:crooked neck